MSIRPQCRGISSASFKFNPSGMKRWRRVLLVIRAPNRNNPWAAPPGAAHSAYGSVIPAGVRPRLPDAGIAILLPADKPDDDSEGADYTLVSSNAALPPSGRMGITMD